MLQPRAPVTVPFVCPACAGENTTNLIALTRAGGMDCSVCGRWLRSSDVARAMHAPRPVREPGAPPVRNHGALRGRAGPARPRA